MNVTPFLALVIVFSLLELLILGGVLFFYLRLRRSETLLNTLQGNQESLLARIEMNARLEREIVATFAQRQGLSSRQIARNAGLSVDEVELILAQNP